MTEYDFSLASHNWLNTIYTIYTDTIFVELPKRKASKTGPEAHKVMLNLPLMTGANYMQPAFN